MIDSQRSDDRRGNNGRVEEDGEAPRFFVDLEVASDRNRALPMLIAGRRCYQCQEGDPEPSVASTDVAGHIERIGDHCAQTPDYLLPDTPLKESIFRIILAGGNEPMSAEEVSGALESRWAMTAHARDISPRVIQILLDNSPSYCIARLPEPEPEVVEEEPEVEVLEEQGAAAAVTDTQGRRGSGR